MPDREERVVDEGPRARPQDAVLGRRLTVSGVRRTISARSAGTEERISAEVKKLKYLKATRSEVIELMMEMLFEKVTDQNSFSEQLERRLIAKRKSIE